MNEGETNPKTRFSNRVENYIRYRPGYPEALVRTLQEHGLSKDWVVADIGSGTGISSGMFLRLGCEVYGIEPNPGMRTAAERLLSGDPRFHSVDASAERTTLPDAGIDLVAAGQAFHWFDRTGAKREFRRILRPGGLVALFWNERRPDSNDFHRAYERLLQEHGTDYCSVNARRITPELMDVFFDGRCEHYVFDNAQSFDYEGLKGRLLSSSYARLPSDPAYGEMMADLQRIFDDNEKSGRVEIQYDTRLYIGRLSRPGV